MSRGRLIFAGALLLGLAWAALRAPVPAIDPRFVKQDFSAGGRPLSISVFLGPELSRERAHELIGACARQLETPGDAGAGLEACAASLGQAGIRNLTARLGGTLVTRGTRGEAPWRIGIRKMRSRGADDVLAYLLEDRSEAMATRGEDEPGTTPRGLRSVTVVAADAPAAELIAGAVFAAGAKDWRATARQRSAAQVVVMLADGTIEATPELAARLRFLHGETARVLP